MQYIYLAQIEISSIQNFDDLRLNIGVFTNIEYFKSELANITAFLIQNNLFLRKYKLIPLKIDFEPKNEIWIAFYEEKVIHISATKINNFGAITPKIVNTNYKVNKFYL